MSAEAGARPAAAAPPTPRASRRWWWLVTALLVQAVLVGLAVAPQLSARWTGDEVRLRVGVVDPIDPFRGAYVQLGYPDLPSPRPMGDDPAPGAGRVYVPLTRHGDLWRGEPAVSQPPSAGPFLACDDQGWRLRCGIESWFVPQDRATQVERSVATGHAVAVVRVDGSGNAALVEVTAPGS